MPFQAVSLSISSLYGVQTKHFTFETIIIVDEVNITFTQWLGTQAHTKNTLQTINTCNFTTLAYAFGGRRRWHWYPVAGKMKSFHSLSVSFSRLSFLFVPFLVRFNDFGSFFYLSFFYGKVHSLMCIRTHDSNLFKMLKRTMYRNETNVSMTLANKYWHVHGFTHKTMYAHHENSCTMTQIEWLRS